MKNGMKFLALGAAVVGAAIGVTAYRKYRDSYEQLPESEMADVDALDEEVDFEPVVESPDDLAYYYIEDPEQIMFYE